MGYKTKLTCPIQRTVALISDKWKVLIICILADGTKRFGELQRAMEGITPTVLTRALRDLESDGLIKRTVFAEVPPRVEYSLMPLGESLLPILEQLHDWAEANADKLQSRQATAGKAAEAPIVKPAA
jgi:DNA-binding HxlR family transcriptional regulator